MPRQGLTSSPSYRLRYYKLSEVGNNLHGFLFADGFGIWICSSERAYDLRLKGAEIMARLVVERLSKSSLRLGHSALF